MNKDQHQKDLFKRRFAASVPYFDDGERNRHPFATRFWIVIFRRTMEPSAIASFMQRLDIQHFRQERNPLTYVLEQPADSDRAALFRKICRCREVRYIGPYRRRGPQRQRHD